MKMAEHIKCNFREKVDVCTFKPEHCHPDYCDMYNAEFSQEGIKAEIEKIKEKKEKIKERVKDLKNIKEEDIDKYSEEEKQRFKKDVENLIKEQYDLEKGHEYMKQALRFCKRSGL